MVEQKILEEFVSELKPETKEKNKTYSAIVSKVDKEGTVWVRVAGSDKDTPTALVGAEVKKGDAVNVEWRNNKLYIASNYSNPAAGVVRAEAVEQAAALAHEAANNAVIDAGRAKEAADSAEASAGQAYNEAQNAKKTATNYIAELSNGIFVHPDGTPGDPHSSEACGVLITDKMEIRKDGATTAIYGDVTRIGNISNETVVYLLENYIEIGEDYFFVSNNGNTIGDFRAGANGVYEKRYSSENEARVKPSGSSEDYSNYEVGRFSIADITFNDGKTLELSLSINGTDLDLSFSDKTNRTIGDVKIVFEQDACIIKYNWQTSTLSYQYSYSYYVYYSRPRLDWHGEIKAFSNLIEHNGTRDISLQISEETIQKYVDLGMSIT